MHSLHFQYDLTLEQQGIAGFDNAVPHFVFSNHCES